MLSAFSIRYLKNIKTEKIKRLSITGGQSGLILGAILLFSLKTTDKSENTRANHDKIPNNVLNRMTNFGLNILFYRSIVILRDG